MERKKIAVFEYAKNILEALPKGILLTTKVGEKVNSMTIGWGTLGIEWSTPVFVAFIRKNRFTREQLDKNQEFTINVPFGAFNKKIVGICGAHSGRKMDKISEAGLTLVESEIISAPAVKELPLTLECKVVYQQKQNISDIIPEYQPKFYPQNVDGSAVGANRDAHIAYYGKIVSAYIIQ
jgi:flavin reductase (DIM6/NTAB) family NADH-FMN oxidoreductase RutF